MIRWRTTQRRWKQAAEDAVAASRFDKERERLAAEVSRRVWVANGGREGAEVRVEGALLALEMLVAGSLQDSVVRASLALTYLDALDGALRLADYEDAPALRAEARWATAYMQPELPLVLSAAEETSVPDTPAATGESRAEGLYRMLAAEVMEKLRRAEIAA